MSPCILITTELVAALLDTRRWQKSHQASWENCSVTFFCLIYVRFCVSAAVKEKSYSLAVHVGFDHMPELSMVFSSNLVQS